MTMDASSMRKGGGMPTDGRTPNGRTEDTRAVETACAADASNARRLVELVLTLALGVAIGLIADYFTGPDAQDVSNVDAIHRAPNAR